MEPSHPISDLNAVGVDRSESNTPGPEQRKSVSVISIDGTSPHSCRSSSSTGTKSPSSPDRKRPFTDEEKRERKRAANRRAYRKLSSKKNKLLHDLQQTISKLTQENQELKSVQRHYRAELAPALKENSTLRAKLQAQQEQAERESHILHAQAQREQDERESRILHAQVQREQAENNMLRTKLQAQQEQAELEARLLHAQVQREQAERKSRILHAQAQREQAERELRTLHAAEVQQEEAERESRIIHAAQVVAARAEVFPPRAFPPSRSRFVIIDREPGLLPEDIAAREGVLYDPVREKLLRLQLLREERLRRQLDQNMMPRRILSTDSQLPRAGGIYSEYGLPYETGLF